MDVSAAVVVIEEVSVVVDVSGVVVGILEVCGCCRCFCCTSGRCFRRTCAY